MAENSLSILNGMQLAPNARQLLKNADKELGAGIAAPFAVIGYKGSKWSLRHRGNTQVLTVKANGSEVPVPYLDLVILHAAEHHSKVYYAKNYQEGDDDLPDCWATNGLVPDPAVPAKTRQADICANCRWNEFGSRTNQATGARGKACADTRRLAVVPYPDIENTISGGPMLLRVPPASLGAVGEYSDKLKANSFPYSALVTRVGFDLKEAYPKFTMEPLVALTEGEIARVAAMQKHPLVERIVQAQLENIGAQGGSEQGEIVNPNRPTTAGQGQKPAASDPGPIPESLRRNGAGQKPPVQSQPAPPAPTPQPEPEPAPTATAAPPAEALTPEQLRIREMEAEIARLKAAGTEPKARKAKRTAAVAPSAVAEPAQTLQPPGETTEDEGEETGEGDGTVIQPGSQDPALAAITARLSSVINRQ